MTNALTARPGLQRLRAVVRGTTTKLAFSICAEPSILPEDTMPVRAGLRVEGRYNAGADPRRPA